MIGHAALLLGIASAVLQDSDVHGELHPDGSLHVEYGTARDSAGRTIRDGKYRRLTPDGVELAAGRYRKGQARGKWTFRHPNGELLARGYFDDGVASREWSFRRADGELWAEGVCAGGHRTGEWTFFDAEGEVDSVRSGVYEHAVARWPVGSVKHRGTLLDGLPFGPWEGWWSDGTPREKGFFVRSK
ncbi:MAG: hypothetical protein O7B99_08625, partial [Planctomycetota bacterium]|nr:hypothetical protein [Planctomycetota bacterium]